MVKPVTIRQRIAQTSRRLARLGRLRAGLHALQRRRRRKLGETAALGPTVMYDSVNLEQIPRDAPAVAGYIGGHWPTFAKLAGRFPRARRLSIAVSFRYDAECLDVEPGDARPEQAVAWYHRQRVRGVRRPVIYTSVSAAPDLLRILAREGIPRNAIRLWTAHYTHHPHLCSSGCGFGLATTADATQWTNSAHGRNLDESLMGRGFWS